MSLSQSAAIEQLASLLGSHGWLEDDADTLKYRTDWRAGQVGEALGVARPATTEQTAATVKIARDAGFAIVPQGGNTGLVQGGIPTEIRATIMISMDRMNQVRSLDADNYALVAEAGCVVQRLQEAAAETGRLFPLSLASEGSCTIGGALSTNAGGNQTIRFGNAREQVLGLEVVMADGTVFDGLNTLRKNNTGSKSQWPIAIISTTVTKREVRSMTRIVFSRYPNTSFFTWEESRRVTIYWASPIL